MKVLILILYSALILVAQNKLEIKSGHISYQNKKQKIIFKNDVEIKYGKNILKMQKATMTLQNNILISYKAQDEVIFFYQDKEKSYNIATDNIYFNVKKNTYTLNGNIVIEDNMSNIIKADKVTINKNMGIFSIEGNQKPVSLEFKIQ